MKHRSFFVPTLTSFHSKEYDYVVQPRVKIRFEKNVDKCQKAWDWIIGTLVEKYDIKDLYVGLAHNWGFCNGKPIIVDYGC